MYGYDNITPEDIRYYAHYKVGQSCTIQDSWQYMLPIKMHPISPIRKIGQISEILQPGANDVWVVKRKGKRDLLLPYIPPVILNVDVSQHRVDVSIMEGLDD